jgi:NAD/NADP transhydrogenase alpha subunit
MSVRTETFGHQAPRIPLVSIVAALLAFAVGIALGAIVMDRDSAVPSGDSGAAVEARGWDEGMLTAAAQRAGGFTQ